MCVEGGHNHSGAIKILKVLSVYNDLCRMYNYPPFNYSLIPSLLQEDTDMYSPMKT